MSSTIHHTRCPVCGSPAIKPVLSLKDYTVSKDGFSIWECSGCSLRFTQEAPDANSIAPYYNSVNYVSHSDTSKGFVNRLYHAVRKHTLKQKRKLVQRVTSLRQGNLLDLGSGTGAFVHEMESHGWNVTGLEPDQGARKIAAERFKARLDEAGKFFHLPAESYDAITLWHVLEHIHDLHGYMTQLKSVLKKNGRLFIAVPNYTSKDAAIYKEYWAAYDVPRHVYHFSPASLQVLVEMHGLQILQYKPMWYDSFYISMLSSKYKNGKVNLVASFLIGLRSNLKAWLDVRRCSSVIYIINK
jgi:2-polyprenyl-3-methyl-5-hydroxy-6-metoxy-1,4-benzoquinol methylase